MNYKLELLISAIESEFKVHEIELKSKSRLKEFVFARYIFTDLALRFCELKKNDIESFLNKNRTSIIHNKKKHRELMQYDKEYRNIYGKILASIYPLKIPIITIKNKRQNIEISSNKFLESRLVNKKIIMGSDLY